MRSIASFALTFSGCVVGTLLAYLRENSGAARATHGIATVAPAAAPASRTLRRVLKIVIMLPPLFMEHDGASIARLRRSGVIMGKRREGGKRGKGRRERWRKQNPQSRRRERAVPKTGAPRS
jgi:hypothetical protein